MVAAILAATLWSTGCSQPTIDGSSQRRYLESIEEVRASLSPDERGRFDNAIGTMETGWAVNHLAEGLGNIREDVVAGLAGKPRQRPEGPTLFQMLHGLTGRQVIELAESGQTPGR